MQIIGARVATSTEAKEGSKRMTYHPAFTNDKGKDINARLTIPILINLKNQELPSNMLITAWGKMTDICAKALNPGREVNMVVEPKQYQTTYKQKGQVVLINNLPLNITGYSYNLKEISFGTESASFIANEITRGLRGPDWFKPGSPDQAALETRRKQINATEYIPGSTSFGYAVVSGTTGAPAMPETQQTTPTTPQQGNVTPEMMAAMMAFMAGQQKQTTQPPTTAPAPVEPQTISNEEIF